MIEGVIKIFSCDGSNSVTVFYFSKADFKKDLQNVKKSNIIKIVILKYRGENFMSSNIADLIEEYILRRMAEQQNNQVELRRNDIAGEISCAPSQISYVLNTRFTHDKGFTVESRRGLGGFNRIVRVPMKDVIYQDMLDAIDENTEYDEIQSMIRYLIQSKLISTREGAIILQTVRCAYDDMEPEKRVNMLKTIFVTLIHFA